LKHVVMMMIVVILALSGCGTNQRALSDGAKGIENSSAVISQTEEEISYVGAMKDNIDIHMRLRIQDDIITGSYYYGTVRVDLPLSGTIDKARQVEIIEYDANGKSTGTFMGRFVSEDRLEGVWNNEKIKYFSKGRNVYPFYMEKENESGDTKQKTLGGKNKALWEGNWNRINSDRSANSGVEISFATNNSFWFELHGQNAGQTSRITGVAVIKEVGAVFTDSKGVEITFILQDGRLTITTTKDKSGDGNIDLNGSYAREVPAPVPVQIGKE